MQYHIVTWTNVVHKECSSKFNRDIFPQLTIQGKAMDLDGLLNKFIYWKMVRNKNADNIKTADHYWPKSFDFLVKKIKFTLHLCEEHQNPVFAI